MAGRVLELRVHGVSNTPPASVLGEEDKEPRRVAGNVTTGFYRPAGKKAASPAVEAYSWGQLTSGQRAMKDVQRALWTLLLPFTLANVAVHARPQIPADPVNDGFRSRSGFNAWLIRVFGLSLTATLVFAATGVGVDLIGWQCVDQACLSAIPGPWEFLASNWWHQGGRAMAFGLLVPLVLLALIGLLTWRSYQYEAVVPCMAAKQQDGTRNPLQHRSFWSGARQVRRLAVLHLTTGAAVAVAVPFAAMVAVDPPQGARAPVAFVVGLILVAIPVVAIVALGHSSITGRSGESTIGGFGRATIILAVPGVLGAIWYLLLPDGPAGTPLDQLRPQAGCSGYGCPGDRSLPGYDDVIFWLATGQVVVLLAIALVSRTRRATWGGAGPTVFAGLGWMLGLAYSAGVLYWMTDVLNRGAAPTGASPITLPVPVMWSGLGISCALLVIALAGGWAVWRYGRLRKAQLDVVKERSDGSLHDDQRAREVASFQAVHELIGTRALRAIGVLFTVGLVLAVGGTVAAYLALRPVPTGPTGWQLAVKVAIDIGNSVAGMLPLVIAAIGVQVYRSDRVRRTVGIVWDVGTFWPRSGHPLAPPSYAERAVPELVTRTAGLLEAPPANPRHMDAIILSGHSQGSVICASVIFQLPPELRRRVWFFSYGSQLTGLYGRAFPAYFNADRLDGLSELLRPGPEQPPQWTNFWRATDPIGWQVAGEHGELQLTDPEALHPTGGEVDGPPIRNHSGYPEAKEFQDTREDVCALLTLAGQGNGSGTNPSHVQRGIATPAGTSPSGSP